MVALGRFDDAHDVFFAHHEQFFAVNLDGLAGIFAEQDLVSLPDIQRTDLAVFQDLAIANRNHLTLVGLLGGGIGNHDAGSGLALFLQALDDYTVVQRTDFHFNSPRYGQYREQALVSTQCLRVLIIRAERPEFKGFDYSRRPDQARQDVSGRLHKRNARSSLQFDLVALQDLS